MTNSQQKFIKKWEQNKALGQWKYGISHGLAFGIIVGIINNLLFYFFLEKGITWENAILNIILTIVLGIIIYSTLLWSFNEKYYQKLKKK